MNYIAAWVRRHFSDPQVVILVAMLVGSTAAIFWLGDMLTPFIAAIVIAYLMQSVVGQLERLAIPHMIATVIVFVVFFALLLLAFFGLLPPLVRQLRQLFSQVPAMMTQAQELLMQLPDRYPLFTEDQVTEFVGNLRADVLNLGQPLFSFSVASLLTVFSVAIYLIVVPLLVFFLIRDKTKILSWFEQFLPAERELTARVWVEVNKQIGNYVRGKVWEIFIVGSVSYTVFTFLGLEYALLLASLTGISVVIPYVGALLVTIPVAIVAFFQWGPSAEFVYALIAYGAIQLLDGNLLAPLLFSEVVDLHPVAIIVAILFFGGVWGLWGVFFAIPLATLIQAVLKAWPRAPDEDAAPLEAVAAGPAERPPEPRDAAGT